MKKKKIIVSDSRAYSRSHFIAPFFAPSLPALTFFCSAMTVGKNKKLGKKRKTGNKKP